jgi:hypothetical protein
MKKMQVERNWIRENLTKLNSKSCEVNNISQNKDTNAEMIKKLITCNSLLALRVAPEAVTMDIAPSLTFDVHVL